MIKRLVVVLLALAVVFGAIFGWKFYQGSKMAAILATPPPPATVASRRDEFSSLQATADDEAKDRVRGNLQSVQSTSTPR